MKNFYQFIKRTFAGTPSTTEEKIPHTQDTGFCEIDLLSGKLFDSMSAQVCVLNSRLDILLTNNAWSIFQRSRLSSAPALISGVNLFESCHADDERVEPAYKSIASGLTALQSQDIDEYSAQLRFSVTA
ncbi:MAG: hypothetical protein RIR26_1858, partial [Pseudomonadota bacterium]